MVSSILRCKTRTEHSGQFTCISLHFDFIETSSLRERIRADRHFVHMLCKMASRQRGVCVKHPKRCKTSNLYFCEPAFFQTSWNPFSPISQEILSGGNQAFPFSRGTRHPWPTVCNEATVLDGISGLITLTYLLNLFHFHPWLPAKPRTGTSNNWKTTIWFRWKSCF